MHFLMGRASIIFVFNLVKLSLKNFAGHFNPDSDIANFLFFGLYAIFLAVRSMKGRSLTLEIEVLNLLTPDWVSAHGYAKSEQILT